MYASKRTFICVVAAAMAMTMGCGDDDTGGVTDSGTDAATDSGADSGLDSGTDSGLDSGTDSGTDAGPAGACTNASDLAAIMRGDYGEMMDQTVAGIAAAEGTACALGGEEGDDLQMCTRDAVVEETEMAVSSECADCYAISVRCSVENCIAVCVADSGSAECIACRCGDNDGMRDCDEAFRDCSGIPTTTCDDV